MMTRRQKGKHGTWENINDQQKPGIESEIKGGLFKLSLSFPLWFYESWILISNLFQFHLNLASEHAKPVMSGDACTQLCVPSRTGSALLEQQLWSCVFTYSLLAHSDSYMCSKLPCHGLGTQMSPHWNSVKLSYFSPKSTGQMVFTSLREVGSCWQQGVNLAFGDATDFTEIWVR